MEPETLSLDTQEPPQPLSLDKGAVEGALPPKVAEQKAARDKTGLPPELANKISYEQIRRAHETGDMSGIQTEVAAEVNYRKRIAKRDAIAETARRLNRQLTPDDLALIDFMYDAEPSAPESVMEEEYAKRFMEYLDVKAKSPLETEVKPWDWTDTVGADLRNADPIGFEGARRDAESVLARRRISEDLAELARENSKNQSWAGWGADVGKMFFPGYREVKHRGETPGVGFFEGGLLGDNRIAQYKELYRLPIPEFKKQAYAIYNTLYKTNVPLAEEFAQGLVEFSQSDMIWDNLFTPLEVAGIYSLGKGTFKLGNRLFRSKETAQAAEHLKSTVQNADLTQPTKVAQAEAVGDLKEAAAQTVVAKVVREKQLVDDIASPTSIGYDNLQDLPDLLRVNTENIKAGPSRLGRELTNRVLESYENFWSKMSFIVNDLQKVEQLPELLVNEQAVRIITEGVKDDLSGRFHNAIINISVPYKRGDSKSWYVDVTAGKPDGTLYQQKSVAENAVRAYGLIDAKVQPHGFGYKIVFPQPLDLTRPYVRSQINTIATTETKHRISDAFLGALRALKLRTPEDILPVEQNIQRKVATYAQNKIFDVIKENSKEIAKLPKWRNRKAWDEFKQVLQAGREIKHPVTGQPGYWFKSPAELETFYSQNFQRMPDAQEIAAYFAYRRNYDADWVLRNLEVLKVKERNGVQSHRVWTPVRHFKRQYSEFFDGILKKEFPGTGDNDNFLLIGDNIFSNRVLTLGKLSTKLQEELVEGVKNGTYKVIQLWDEEARPLKGYGKEFKSSVGNKKIKYVVSKNVETQNLKWQQLAYREGGHFDYEYDWYVKQARIIREGTGAAAKHRYEGDITILPVMLQSMGADIADKLNAVRELIKAKRFDDARRLAGDTLPWDWKEVRGWFSKKKVNGEFQPPMLSVHEPIRVIRANTNMIDVDNALSRRYSNFKNDVREGSLARRFQVEYTQERDSWDLMTVKDVGTAKNPLYKLEPAPQIDPITTMNRALSKITNSSFLNDYKIFAVEHWLKEAQNYLKSAEQVWSAPFYHFHNALTDFLPGADPIIVDRLKAQHYQIQQLMGVQNVTDKILHTVASKLSDTIYKNLGPKALPFDPAWMLPFTKDPFGFLRGVTFHAKIGLWTIPQFLVQLQTFTVIAGLSPRSAVSGAYGAMLSQWSRINPSHMDVLDRMASRLKIPGFHSFKPGQFKESMEELEKVGFKIIAGEHALTDNPLSNKVVRSGIGHFLDAGTFFFKEGERTASRFGAWHTAYLEFRQKKPLGKITDRERSEILYRADTLSNNMSRASSSILHTGVMSVPTQFLTYQIRLGELFWGKRLGATWQERSLTRMRLLATQAMFYGAPTALGVTGLPLGDILRKSALENNYVVGDDWIESMVYEGIPSILLTLATGKEYNVGDRFGAQGFETIREALRGDKNFWEILGGPVYSTMHGAVSQFMGGGLSQAITSLYRGDEEVFPITMEDWIDVFKEISLVNNTWRLFVALETGKWMSKKGAYLDDTSPSNAIFMYLTGMQPQEVADLNLQAWTLKNQEEFNKHVLEKFTIEFRRGLRELSLDNDEQAKKFFTRANVYLTMYPPEKVASAIAIAQKDHESLIERINHKFYIREVPVAEREGRRNALRRRIEIKEQRGDR